MMERELVDEGGDLGALLVREGAPLPLPPCMEPTGTPDEVLIKAVCVGRAKYPLRPTEGVLGRFQDGKKGRAFCVDPFLPFFVGEGQSDEEAVRHWCELVHVSAQRLRATLDIPRTSEEQSRWDLLCGLIDVDAVEASSAFPGPWEVQWEDGRLDQIPLEAVPADFVTFEVGDWLEAAVDRHPRTGDLLYIHEAHPAEGPRPVTQEQAASYWDSLPTLEADSPLAAGDESRATSGPRPAGEKGPLATGGAPRQESSAKGGAPRALTGTVHEVEASDAVCWLEVGSGVRVKFAVPLPLLRHLNPRPGLELLWSPGKDGGDPEFWERPPETPDPNLIQEVKKLNHRFREGLKNWHPRVPEET
jgi:hypothetical protein